MAPSLSKSIESNFFAGVRQRGNEYFFGDRVSLANGNGDSVYATVRGHGRYDVHIRWSGDDLMATCTCPYYRDVDLCKHVWATVRAAEREGFLLPLRSSRPAVLMDDGIGDAHKPSAYRPVSAQKPKPPQPTWRSAMDRIRSQTTAPSTTAIPKEQELSYHLIAPSADYVPTLAVMERTRKRNSEWSKVKVFRTDGSEIPALADPLDREAVTLLHGMMGSYAYNVWQRRELAGLTPTNPMWEVLLPLLGRTDRFFLLKGHGDVVGPLGFDDGPPWHLRMQVEALPGGKGYKVTGSFHREDLVRDFTESLLVLRCGWVFWKDAVSRFHDHGSFGWITALRATGSLIVPEKDLPGFMEECYSLASRPPMTWPESCGVREFSEPPQMHLALEPGRSNSSTLLAMLRFQYGEQFVDANEPGSGILNVAKRSFHARDTRAEESAERELKRLGFGPSYFAYGDNHTHTLDVPLAGRVVPELIAAGWHVTGHGKLYRSATFTEIRVSSGVDWFDLEGGARYGDEEVPIPALLRALREGTGYVELGDGTLGLLPEAWLKKIGLATSLGESAGDRIRVARQRASLLDVLLAEIPDIRADEAFERVRAELRDFQRIEPADPPAGFQGHLRDYQRDGLGWFDFLRRFGFGGCLADDMGLGKTVQVLALLEGRRTGKDRSAAPTLVVAPKSLIFNWIEEAKRFAPKLHVFDHSGLARARSETDFKKAGVILTTYGTMRRDIAWLKDVKFDYIVLDEAQAVKNSSTQNAKAVRLLQGAHRLALSGTPIENHMGELWSLFAFLNPGMLGGAGVLKQFSGDRAEPDTESRALLARALRPFILRRTKSQVAKELPARTENTIHCDLPASQRKLYNELKEHYQRNLLGKVKEHGIGRSKIQILEALLRLRQAACHPALLKEHAFKDDSAKMTALIPQLQEVVEEGHKALVFSQFTSFLALVRERLDAEKLVYEYLDGKTRDRQARVERFQNDPACGIFLISLKAGGLGLNLTAAEYVFLLDPWWNPAVEAQAIDRAHRIGQTRNVFAYRLIARDTIEDKILELQAKKRNLADSIIMADDSLLRTLTREDLEILLA